MAKGKKTGITMAKRRQTGITMANRRQTGMTTGITTTKGQALQRLKKTDRHYNG